MLCRASGYVPNACPLPHLQSSSLTQPHHPSPNLIPGFHLPCILLPDIFRVYKHRADEENKPPRRLALYRRCDWPHQVNHFRQQFLLSHILLLPPHHPNVYAVFRIQEWDQGLEEYWKKCRAFYQGTLSESGMLYCDVSISARQGS